MEHQIFMSLHASQILVVRHLERSASSGEFQYNKPQELAYQPSLRKSPQRRGRSTVEIIGSDYYDAILGSH